MKTPKVKLVLRDKTPIEERPLIQNSMDAFQVVRLHYPPGQLQYREFAFAVYLNRASRVLGVQKLCEGGTTSAIVDMKMIFTGALLCGASAIIMSHNHPSGQLEPSKADLTITKKAKEAGKVLDIDVIDHIIVTEKGYYSFGDNEQI